MWIFMSLFGTNEGVTFWAMMIMGVHTLVKRGSKNGRKNKELEEKKGIKEAN